MHNNRFSVLNTAARSPRCGPRCLSASVNLRRPAITLRHTSHPRIQPLGQLIGSDCQIAISKHTPAGHFKFCGIRIFPSMASQATKPPTPPSAPPPGAKTSGFRGPLSIKIAGFNQEAEGFVTYSLDLQLLDCDSLFPVQSARGTSWTVRRRYSEFLAMHQALDAKDSFRNMLPPMPPKVIKIFGGDAAEELASDRKSELQHYICVVASNPLVYTSPEFCEFLEISLRESISVEHMIQLLKASADKCGWLMKQGKYSISGWKRRWFMLHSGFLLYFENEASPLNLGMINVSECTVIPGADEPGNPAVDFSMHHPQKREFKLRCESAEEMPDWCRTLTAMESRVRLEDFELLSVIGQGTFGKVVRAKKKGTTDLYAIKILKKSHVRETAQIDHTMTERQVLQKVVHPYVVNLRYAFQTEDKLYMVMDYVRGGELYQHLKKFKFFDPQRVRLFAAEILLALSYLHDMHFVYRDLKPENLLLDEEGHIRLTDFGLAKKMGRADVAKTFCGTPEYMAPEILQEVGHSFAVDWWCLGILIYEMHTGCTPFVSPNKKEMYINILKNPPKYHASFPPLAKDLCNRLLHKDPKSRLGAAAGGGRDIQAHDYFKGIDFDALLRREIAMKPEWIPVIKGDHDVSLFDPKVHKMDVSVEAAGGGARVASDEFDGFTFVDKSSALDTSKPELRSSGLSSVTEAIDDDDV